VLGKLLKHEFWATSRFMLPIYAGSLILALINRLFISVASGGDFHLGPQSGGGVLVSVLSGVFVFLFIIVMMAIPVITLIFIIRRFYTHLLKAEGYLTHTLPVSVDSLLWGKLIPAFTWTVASGGVMILSIMILLGGFPYFDYIRYILPAISEILSEYNISGFLIIVILVLAAFYGILHYYISLSVGQLANRRKILAAIGMYFGIYFASSILFTSIVQAMIFNAVSFNVNSVLLTMMFIYLIPGVVYYVISRYLLKNRLNLE